MPESVAKKLFAPNDDVREYANHISVADLIKFEEALPAAPPGGSISANHGNTVYVSADGDNGTGEVGNISLPYETANDAIAALDPASAGSLIILSSTSQIDITDYDTTSYPYSLTITNFSYQNISVKSSGSFGLLTVKTPYGFIIDTRSIFTIDDTFNLECDTFTVTATAEGAINMIGTIKCNVLNIFANALVTISADVLEWSKLAIVGVTGGFTYNICPPRQWKAVISQTDTDHPVVDAVLKNTYGEVFTTNYEGTGFIKILNAGSLFATTKTQVYFGTSNLNTVGGASFMNKGNIDPSYIEIFSFDQFIGLADNQIKSLDITIETYL